MSRPEEKIFTGLCHKPETVNKARALYRTAKMKTGPGSGHDLGTAAVGLPAVCAYIASLELGNGDVTEAAAQPTSCLAPKSFANTVNIVRSVLDQAVLENNWKVKYEDLIVTHKVLRGELVIGWLNEAEKILLESGQVRLKGDAGKTVLKCAVFYWTTQLLFLARIKPEHLIVRHSIDREDFDELLPILEDVCLPLVERIKAKVVQLQAEVKAKAKQPASLTSPKKTPSKAPSKPALKRMLPTPSIPEPASGSPSKRKVAFVQTSDLADALPETPTKRRRVATSPASTAKGSPASTLKEPPPAVRAGGSKQSVRPEGESAQATPTIPPPRVASITPRRSTRLSQSVSQSQPPPARQMIEEEQHESSDDETEEDRRQGLSRSRHFRAPFIDRAQWFRRDPKIEREWKMAEAHRQRMVDAYGHPLTRLRQVLQQA